MKQFIKDHPWRLEIVPGSILVFAVVWPLIFRSEMISSMHYSANEWAFQEVFQIAIMIVWAAMGAWGYQMWVKGEQRKKFCYVAPFYAMLICLYGRDMFHWHFRTLEISWYHISQSIVYDTHLYGRIWLLSAPVAGVAQAIMEWTRPFRPQPRIESVTGASDVRPGDSFYYREVLVDWQLVLLLPLCCIVAGLAIMSWLLVLKMAALIWLIIAVAVAVAASSTAWYAMKRLCVTYIISPERVTCRNSASSLNALWAASSTLSIRITGIKECSVFWLDSTELKRPYFKPADPSYMRPLLPRGKFGACLRVETIDSKAYLLGLKNPETACKLIQTAIEARNEQVD